MGTNIRLLLILVGLTLHSLAALANPAYPESPDPALTPGSFCETATEYRYPEQIRYCERNVSTETKLYVIRLYEERLGYRIHETGRNEFKIDHLIPLCMGGSNAVENLWPQHKSIYAHTDPVEQSTCEKLAAGRITQREAVETVMRAKKVAGY